MGAQSGEQVVCKRIPAHFPAIERTDIGGVDRVALFQPVQTGVERAPVPREHIRLILRIDLFARFIEAGPKEVANTANDRFLEGFVAAMETEAAMRRLRVNCGVRKSSQLFLFPGSKSVSLGVSSGLLSCSPRASCPGSATGYVSC